MNNNPTPDQTAIRELLISFRNGTINPDPKLWAFDVEKDLELALAAISKLIGAARVDELESLFVDFDDRKLRHIDGTKLTTIEDRIKSLKKGI